MRVRGVLLGGLWAVLGLFIFKIIDLLLKGHI